MTTEQYQIGYEAGYSDGFDAGAAEPAKEWTDENVIARQAAEIERLRKDAERYRWLRTRFATEWLTNFVDHGHGRQRVSMYADTRVSIPNTYATIGQNPPYTVSAQVIDAAIDAAIQKETP